MKVDGGDGVLIVMTLEWREGRREKGEGRTKAGEGRRQGRRKGATCVLIVLGKSPAGHHVLIDFSISSHC